jgi:hypothetical protein
LSACASKRIATFKISGCDRGEGGKVSSRPTLGVSLADDINARVADDASLDELLVKIKSDLVKFGPFIDLDARLGLPGSV